MKRTLLSLLFIIINLLCVAQSNGNCLKTIFVESPKLELPFYVKKYQNLSYKVFEDEIIKCALLQNDNSKLFYHFYYYDIDLMKNTEKINKYYYRILGCYKKDYMTILMYNKGGNDTSETFLCTYIKDELIDKLVVGFEEGGGDTEMTKYKEGVITEKLEIKTRYYEWNPEYSNKKLKENPEIPRTVVTLSDYKIDINTGKIILIKQEKKYSKCVPEEFSYKDCNCVIF